MSSVNMGEVTVATKASSKFASLRTTIPMSVVKQWKLKDGDKLDWEWKVIDGKMALVVTNL
jgi:Antidote-toxin recognition MazE, bacterial antitoxin